MDADGFAVPAFAGNALSGGIGGVGGSRPPGGGAYGAQQKIKKRTKTGCLTCRKRRIKCGEERPTCNNCSKSKRLCEGYIQRVVFKPPMSDWAGAMPSPTAFGYPQEGFYANNGFPVALEPIQIPPPSITRSPSSALAYTRPGYFDGQMQAYSAGQPAPGQISPLYTATPHSADPRLQGFQGAPFGFSPASPHHQSHFAAMGQSFGQPAPGDAPLHSPPLQSPYHPDPSSISQQYAPSPNFPSRNQQQQHNAFPPTPVSQDFQGPSGSFMFPTAGAVPSAAHGVTWAHDSSRRPSLWSVDSGNGILSPSPYQTAHPSFANSQQQLSQAYSVPGPAYTPPEDQRPVETYSPHQATLVDSHISPTQMLNDAAVEHQDDDYYDVQPEEESKSLDLLGQHLAISASEGRLANDVAQRDQGKIMQLYQDNISETTMRRYDNFIHPGVLEQYNAGRAANPLRNEQTKRVFAHFITATGPTLSIFERNPRNTSAYFDDSGMPVAKQGLWTHTMPNLSLHHPALLQAMLALASLHIAKLQNVSLTPSLKHYAYSIKGLSHSLQKNEERFLPSTLAATLLLGFYEVLTADHLKWSSHLDGAKHLLSNLNFRQMSIEAYRPKTEGVRRDERVSIGGWDMAMDAASPTNPTNDPNNVDRHLLQILTGRSISMSNSGGVVSDAGNEISHGFVPRNITLQDFELYQDLFWWYAKQDVYQAILSGNPLLLPYERWSDCPPRAAINRSDAVHGSWDHLILLLGRIAEFTAEDRKRKISVMNANGGQWRPPTSLSSAVPGPSAATQGTGGSTSGSNKSRTGHAQTQDHGGGMPLDVQFQPPPFYGMAPARPPGWLPSSFQHGPNSPMRHAPPQATQTSVKPDPNLKAATESALHEWASIKQALDLLESSLGSRFQPLSADATHQFHGSSQQDMSALFGAVLQYPAMDMAVLWAYLYTAHIILIRSHPHMPPAAMVAAGVAAPKTAHYAQKIGQIAVGIIPPPRDLPLNPSTGAPLCELSIPLFFAGIQYRDSNQRAWLVSRIRDIERRTGWASVGMVGHGCETAWMKAAELGKGPPYVRQKFDPQVEKLSSEERLMRRLGGSMDALTTEDPNFEGDAEGRGEGNDLHSSVPPGIATSFDPNRPENYDVTGLSPQLQLHTYPQGPVLGQIPSLPIRRATHGSSMSIDKTSQPRKFQQRHQQPNPNDAYDVKVEHASSSSSSEEGSERRRQSISQEQRQQQGANERMFERKNVHSDPPSRVQWAMGVLGENEDSR